MKEGGRGVDDEKGEFGGWGREGFATDIRGTENGQAVSTLETSPHVSVSPGHERLDPAQRCTLSLVRLSG